MWLDLDRTLEEIGRFSQDDAVSYRRMLDEFEEVKGVYGAYRFTPIGYGPSLDERLADHPHGTVWMRRNVMSAWDVIRREFESRHIRAFMAWMAFQTAQPLDSPGSGYLAYSLIGGRQRRSWSIPLGGSASLPRATVAAIEKAGGEVITNSTRRVPHHRGRTVCRRRDQGGRSIPGETWGRLLHPHQDPRGDGPVRVVGR